MNLSTPYRLATALTNTEGRRRYRSAVRGRLWGWLGQLPRPLEIDGRLSGKLTIRLNTFDQVISRSIFASGEWEPLELRFIRESVKPGMVVFDVGANIGAHTLTLADAVGPRGVVHAFEPTRVFDVLDANVARNGFGNRVRLNRVALGDRPGMTRFMACKPGNELFTSRGVPLAPDVATGAYVEFPVMTLDDYAARNGIGRIDFMKVDVEGSEVSVFRGAQRLLASRAIGCLLFELSDVCLANSGSSSSELLDCVGSAGYRLARLSEDGALVPLPSDVQGLTFNVVATL